LLNKKFTVEDADAQSYGVQVCDARNGASSKSAGNIKEKGNLGNLQLHHHFIKALPHVKPLPNAAIQTRSPSFILPSCNASHNAIGIVAAVVFP
jgi:hypothetical protein